VDRKHGRRSHNQFKGHHGKPKVVAHTAEPGKRETLYAGEPSWHACAVRGKRGEEEKKKEKNRIFRRDTLCVVERKSCWE